MDLDPTQYPVGSVWYVLGDEMDRVTIVKCCKKTVRVDGYYHDRKLMDPHLLYPTPCEPRIITQMAECQKEIGRRAEARRGR